MRAVVLGLGNPILTDDGVGLGVARQVAEAVGGLDVATTPLTGLEVLDLLAGYDRAYVVDAMTTRGGIPGQWKRLGPGDASLHLFSSHGTGFFELLELGRRVGLPLPDVRATFGIEIGECVAFGEEPTANLLQELPAITAAIAEDIRNDLESPDDKLEHRLVRLPLLIRGHGS